VKPVFVTTLWSMDVHDTTAEGASTERRCAPPGRKTIRRAPEDPDASAADASAESNPVWRKSSKEDPMHEGGSTKQAIGEQGRGKPVVPAVGCALVERDRVPWKLAERRLPDAGPR
jgi:hypothetical protein